jgi:hypothetical protein
MLGEPITIAGRLVQRAAPGDILLAHDTYRQVRGLFAVQVRDALLLPGRTAPLAVYAVTQAKPRQFRLHTRGIEGIETRMIGREAELRQLQTAFATARDDGEPAFITIVSEAGLGKSRLLYEFEAWVDLLPETTYLFKGRALSTDRRQAYVLLHDLFVLRCDIQDDDLPAAVCQKLEASFGQIFGASDEARLRARIIGHLLGFALGPGTLPPGLADDPRQIYDRALHDLGEYFRQLASALPVLILLEDLHAADDASLDALGAIFETLNDTRLLIVAATRPSLYERRPHWGEGQPSHMRLDLRPLAARDSRRLVEELLQRLEETPAALRERVVGQAEGNPFYVEELIKMLIDTAAIRAEDERWSVDAARLAAAQVPPTLMGVLQARLDDLSPPEHAALQRAAVVGRVFWDRAVAELADEPAPGLELLGSLRRRELILLRERSAFTATQEYTFKHALLRDVAYERVLKQERRAYHGRAARWLAQVAEQVKRVAEYAGRIAEHYDQAGATVEAAIWYGRAGQHAAAQYANDTAVACLSRALELTPADDVAARFELLLARERIYDLQADRAAQATDLNELELLAAGLDHTSKAELGLRKAFYVFSTGEYSAAIPIAQLALASAEAAGAAALAAEAYLIWGRALLVLYDVSAAHDYLQQALRRAREAQSSRVEVESLRVLSSVVWYQDGHPAARIYAKQALALARAIGDCRGEAYALLTYRSNLEQADSASSQAYAEQALRIFRSIGDRTGEGSALTSLALDAGACNDYTRARMYYEQAQANYRLLGNRSGESSALINLGENARCLGDYAAARMYQEQAQAGYRLLGGRGGEMITLLNLGLIAHAQGDHATALTHSQAVLDLAALSGASEEQSAALQQQGTALAGLGRLDEAVTAYIQARDIQHQRGAQHYWCESIAGLARVALLRGQAEQARDYVEQILPHLEQGLLVNAEEAFRTELTCYEALRAVNDPRARTVLEPAHAEIQRIAAQLADEAERRMFFENVPWHRAIIAAWAEKQASA